MEIVFLPGSGEGNAIPQSHVARLAAEKRRKVRERLALDCMNGGPLPEDHRLLVKLPRRGQADLLANVGNRLHRPCKGMDSCEDVSCQYHHPVPILSQGNSDPFKTAVVVIDAIANELLVFNRDCFVPWINSMEKGKNQEASYNNKLVQTNVVALHDETTAHASLASLAMVLANATGNEKYRAYALGLIRHAYRGLRLELASSQDDRAAMRIFTLFRFEIMAHNSDAAAIHIQALQNLLIEQRKRGQTLNPRLLSAAGWNDNIRILRFLSPPIFDLEVLEPLDDIYIIARQHGFVGAAPSDFAKSGIPPRTQELYLKFTDLLLIGRAFNDPLARSFLTSRTANSWFRTAAILTTKLNKAFFEARNGLALGFEDAQLLHREAATALAAVYLAFAVSNFESLDIGDGDHWRHVYPTLSVSATVLGALGAEIEAIDWTDQDEAPPSLLLWILYVMTLSEQAMANVAATAISTGYRSRYNLKFVAQARSMGLWYWTEVQEKLRRYLYFADKGTASKAWFERAMEECDDKPWTGRENTARNRGSEEPERYSATVDPLLSAYQIH